MSVDPEQREPRSLDPAELLQRHPRNTWHERRSPTVEFWLEVHDGFRRECVALTMVGDDYREGRRTAQELAAGAAPRLRGMIAHLRGHHEIEDHHYFPTFRELDSRLAAGFDRLANDHLRLQTDIAESLAALADLVAAAGAHARAAPADSAAPVAVRHAAERYVEASDRLFRRLVAHLRDEEDLIIPLLLERV